jgi:four helix bundle protein
MSDVRSYRDLVVWQKGMELVEEAYKLAKLMPKTEEYRLTSQLLRAAVSIPANIAEGSSRGTRRDYANFISIAIGSLGETETLLELVVRCELVGAEHVERAQSLADEIGRMLNVLRQRLAESAD